jgi:hypothetical protein
MLERIVKRLRKDETTTHPSDAAKARDAVLGDILKVGKELHGLAERRNHLMHGFWTTFHPPVGGETVGSYYDRYRDKPIMVGTLPTLTDKAAKLSSDLWQTRDRLEQIRQGLFP